MKKMVFLYLSFGCCLSAFADTRIGILTNSVSDMWTALRDAALSEAGKEGVVLDFRMPSPATIDQQQTLARQMVESGVAALALCPIAPQEQLAFLNELASKTNLVALYEDMPEVNKRAFLCRDDHQVGVLLGDLVKSVVPEQMKVMAFCNTSDTVENQARLSGLRTYDGESYILEEPQADHGDKMLAAATISEILKKRPEIACLIGLQEYHPLIMARAVMDAGRARMVRIVGMGVSAPLHEALQHGVVHGLVIDDLPGTASIVISTLKSLAEQDSGLNIPQDGRIVLPLATLKTNSTLSVQEMMDALKVQVPWISETDPKHP